MVKWWIGVEQEEQQSPWLFVCFVFNLLCIDGLCYEVAAIGTRMPFVQNCNALVGFCEFSARKASQEEKQHGPQNTKTHDEKIRFSRERNPDRRYDSDRISVAFG